MTVKKTIEYEEVRLAALDDDDRQLMAAAIEATNSAYAPYSHFHVGAAARLADGTVVCGSNQENVAYPSGMCAERTALFAAGAQHAGQPVVALAIVGRTPEGALTAALPCGACRQVMAEQRMRQSEALRVLCYRDEDKIWLFADVEALLPFAFSM